jgi:oligopeptide transport system ATP-binding protein
MLKYISDYIGVMFNGHLVELASSAELYNNPLHPYTKSLISAIPTADPRNKRKRIPYNDLTGDYSFDKSQWIEISPQHFIYKTIK